MADGSTDMPYSSEEFEFIQAVEAYKKQNKVKFPTFSEILAVAKALGYRKVEKPSQMPNLRGEPKRD